jgi:hypothetical protein
MSAGHPRPNARHAGELAELLTDPAVARRLDRRFRVDTDHDVPDLAGYNIAGDVIYIDRHFWAAIKSGATIAGRRIAAAALARALVTHEHVEKSLIDAKGYKYPEAHELATVAEHTVVRRLGIAPNAYEAFLKPFIKRVAVEQITDPPKDLDATPYHDDPDANDWRVLEVLQRLGVTDASRSKHVPDRDPGEVQHAPGVPRAEQIHAGAQG